MFKWVRRIWGMVTNKIDSVLDSVEDPKAALNQVLKDMKADIQKAEVAVGRTEIQARRSRSEQISFSKKAAEFRRAAERLLSEGQEIRAKQMLQRAIGAEKTAESFAVTAENLEMDIARLSSSIEQKKEKYNEAKNTKCALLAQRQASENLSRLNSSSLTYNDSNAFSEYDRINEKISDQAIEAQTLYAMSTDYVTDSVAVESSLDTEFEALKKKVGFEVPRLENKSSDEDFALLEQLSERNREKKP